MATVQPRRIPKAFAAWLDLDTFTEESLSTNTHQTMEPKKKRALKLSKLYSFACAMSHAAHLDVIHDGDAEHKGFSRVVHCNHPELSPEYGSNYVATTKYNMLTFVPKSLFEQFRRVANIYFLFAAACSLTPIAPFSPVSLILPLVFVVGVSMVKEAMEDWRRFLQVLSLALSLGERHALTPQSRIELRALWHTYILGQPNLKRFERIVQLIGALLACTFS